MLCGSEETKMPMEKAVGAVVRPIREYPTEWTWYPADEEDNEQQEQRAEGRDKQAETVTSKLN